MTLPLLILIMIDAGIPCIKRLSRLLLRYLLAFLVLTGSTNRRVAPTDSSPLNPLALPIVNLPANAFIAGVLLQFGSSPVDQLVLDLLLEALAGLHTYLGVERVLGSVLVNFDDAELRVGAYGVLYFLFYLVGTAAAIHYFWRGWAESYSTDYFDKY